MNSAVSQGEPLIVHIVFRFDYGGLENGVVNIVNALAGARNRHVVIALTEASDFRERVSKDVKIIELGKKPGKDFASYVRLYRLFRKLKPTIVHTRNIGTIDCAIVAFLAGIPVRIHGEHGWDVDDPDGLNSKHRLMRRVASRFVRKFVTVSEELSRWLIDTVGISAAKVIHICNGVDSERFAPKNGLTVADFPFGSEGARDVIIGSVTRFSEIKDPINLVDAFIRVAETRGRQDIQVKLMMIGDGALRQVALQKLEDAGLGNYAWLPGSRDDIPELLRVIDIFVLGSYREGISNTILEAMSTGLPVIATDTGGNPELVKAGVNGILVPPSDSVALSSALQNYIEDQKLRHSHGIASRQRVEDEFSIDRMVEQYGKLYQSALAMEGY